MNLTANEDYTGNLLAVLDETSPMIGAGVYYVVTTAIIVNPATIVSDLDGFFADTPNRKKPFHWHREGQQTITKMIDLIIGHQITATVLYRSVSRKGQKFARQDLLKEHARRANKLGVSHLILEASDPRTNVSDLDVIAVEYPGGEKPFRYEHRRKTERTLWVADTFCGAVSDFLRNTNPKWYNELDRRGLIKMEYI